MRISPPMPFNCKTIKGNVLQLKGIGVKSADALAKVNITTIDQLKTKFMKSGVQWLRKTLPRGVRWKMVVTSIVATIP